MSQKPNQAWHKIAESLAEIDFGPNKLAQITVAGKTITLALHHEQLFACPQKCPHAGGVLADGYLDTLGNLVCPLHRYKFSLINGRNLSGEGYFLKTFSTEQRADGIFINLEKPIVF